jgi:hypothetical protein
MGMDIDKTGGDNTSPRVDFLMARRVKLPHRGNQACGNANVGPERKPARPIDDHPIPDHEIVHSITLFECGRQHPREQIIQNA